MTWLYIAVFGSGAILMSLEMLGSRLMAPHFGSSIYVWGSLISVFMTALSAGYYLGGPLADRRPRPSTLSWLLAAAGFLTAWIPLLADPVAAAMVGWGPRAGALAAAMTIFLPPTLLLGMVSPVATRLAVAEIATVGKATGRLSAVSTAGSILGTLLTTFLLVPLAGTKLLITGLAAALFCLVALSLVAVRRYSYSLLTAALAIIILLLGPSGALAGRTDYLAGVGVVRTIYAVESAYHNIRVMDGGGNRYLRFDRSWQTGMSIADPFQSSLSYTDYFHLAMAQNPAIKRVLVVGLGGGAAPKQFWKAYPQVQVDVVELDPVVVDVARAYFALPEDERLQVFTQDGRRFIESTNATYDLIILDAYHADSIPFHLTTREFVQSLSARLSPDGLLAFNLIGSFEGEESEFFRAFYKTVGALFPTQLPVATWWQESPDPAMRRNIILFATRAELNAAAFTANVAREADRLPVAGLDRLVEGLYTSPIRTDDVAVLTDDHAPVDNMIKVME